MQRFAEGRLPPRPHPTGPGMPDAAAPLTQGAKASRGVPEAPSPLFPGRWLSSSCSTCSNRPGIGGRTKVRPEPGLRRARARPVLESPARGARLPNAPLPEAGARRSAPSPVATAAAFSCSWPRRQSGRGAGVEDATPD